MFFFYECRYVSRYMIVLGTEWAVQPNRWSARSTCGSSCVSTTGRLPFELDSTTKRELDGPTPEAERLEKWFLATALNMDDLKGVMERGGIPERKFDFTDGSSCLEHVDVDNLTGPLRAVLVQVRWSGDMQDQVRDGNEQTAHGRTEISLFLAVPPSPSS